MLPALEEHNVVADDGEHAGEERARESTPDDGNVT